MKKTAPRTEKKEDQTVPMTLESTPKRKKKKIRTSAGTAEMQLPSGKKQKIAATQPAPSPQTGEARSAAILRHRRSNGPRRDDPARNCSDAKNGDMSKLIVQQRHLNALSVQKNINLDIVNSRKERDYQRDATSHPHFSRRCPNYPLHGRKRAKKQGLMQLLEATMRRLLPKLIEDQLKNLPHSVA